MLRIRSEKHLARFLGMDVAGVRSLADSAESYCEELELHDPARPGRVRRVLDVHGQLRKAQEWIYRGIFLRRLLPSNHSYGGIKGRHIKLNAEKHLKSQFAFTCDIADFYPSIHSSRVYDFMVDGLDCSPDVGRLLARLCTYNYCLSLGLVTSPLLADQFLKPVDARISEMARRAGLVYTRYVDDITLSGPFDLACSGFPSTMKAILETNGFALNDHKSQFGSIGDPEVLITKIRINKGRLDVAPMYYLDLRQRLRHLRALGFGGEYEGPYYTSGQMWGRVQFVRWVNRRRSMELSRLYSSVPWAKVREVAAERGLVAARKHLRPVADGA